MGKVHLGAEILSAFADGELEPAETREAQAHLDACQACSAELASFARLDGALTAAPAVDCAGSLDLRSALLDGQLTAAEASVARAHVEACPHCAADEVAWLASEQALRTLPAALPSERVDAAMRRLLETGRARRAPAFAGLVPAAGLRVGLAAALVLAIVIGLVPTGGAPQQAQAPDQALVSSVQRVVLYSPTNTLYVLQERRAAVDAIDAATYALQRRINVGGKPTAIALDAFASRILVLDATNKSLIEIDPAVNEVVRSTPVGVSGTPTSLRVANDGKVVVTAAREPVGGSVSGPRPTPKPAAGEVAILDGQRKLEVVRSVEVAPMQVITDPEGKSALLLSPTSTTLVDSSYAPQRTLPGGVGAAYGSDGRIAVLGRSGADAVLHLFGDGAPQPLRLSGIPLAVTSMPEGGFAVLLGSGSGNGRIVVIDGAGAPVGTTPVDQIGSLTYDAKGKRFTIVNADGEVVSAALPAGVIAGQPEDTLTPAPSPSVAPSIPVVPPSAPPVQPSASASPLASPSPSAPVAAQPSALPAVPRDAQRITDTLYRLPLAQQPILTTASSKRVWFLDQSNVLNALDPESGSVYRVAQLPAGVLITALAATETHVVAVEGLIARVHVLSVSDERLTSVRVPPILGLGPVATTSDGWVWIAASSGHVVRLDPSDGRMDVVDLGMPVGVIVGDADRGVWYSDGGSRLGRYDRATGLVTELLLPARGAARSLLPGGPGTLWVGTTEGEVISVRDRTGTVVASLGGTVTALRHDGDGGLWALARSAAAADRFVLHRIADGGQTELPGPATSLSFTRSGRAWLADPLGGFYLAVEPGR